ncbi:MAG: hypothetical protein IPH44_14245 [Myxococcales bacterium]|nr:hypothetical protein [Myxococcales bacterium]MBK7193088.1 hypothetical protein [Myxococcales bacterium]MBP6845273.1 hypothetical protein [Kofleriaceae bacterium]
MQTLDIRTLVLVASVAAAATAVLFLVIGRPQRRVAPELSLWAAAFASNAVGLTLIYLRGLIPAVVSFTVANLLILAATQLLLVGLDVFVGQRRLRHHAAYFAVAAMTLFAASRHGAYAVFAGTLSVVLFVPAVALCVRLLRMPQPGMRAERVVLVVLFVMEGALLVIRGVGAALGHSQATLFAPSPATILLYFGVILAPMLVGPALLALVGRREQLAKERLIGELTTALAEVRTLRGLLSICASCKQIRDDAGAWTSVERYVARHSDAEFTHGICPTCAARLYPDDGDGGGAAA